MVEKRVFVIGIFLVLLFSFVCSATISDGSTNVTVAQESTQNFAQINARLTELANQINAYRSQDQNFQANAFLKSDLQGLYDNMVNINRQAEQQIILDNIIIVVLAFAIMFILIGKNLLPQNPKKEPKVKNDSKKVVTEPEIIVPETFETDEGIKGGI